MPDKTGASLIQEARFQKRFNRIFVKSIGFKVVKTGEPASWPSVPATEPHTIEFPARAAVRSKQRQRKAQAAAFMAFNRLDLFVGLA